MNRGILIMGKYKVNIDKPGISDADIEKHKNFDSLMGQYQKLHSVKHATKPLYQDKKFLSLIMLIFIVLLALFFAHEEKTDEAPGTEKDSPPALDSTINKDR